MDILPPALSELIEALAQLPGVGPRSAERYGYFLLRSDPNVAQRLTAALTNLRGSIGFCQKTFALVPKGQKLSNLYSDPSRDKKLVAVVAEPFDLIAIETTGQYKGTYHVLGGLISPLDGVSPDQLHIAELIKRIDEDKVKEIILATNASVEGESTALYIQKMIGERPVKLSRLARGLSVGVDLIYADQLTLGRAITQRQNV
jgi:recombination protein RecR